MRIAKYDINEYINKEFSHLTICGRSNYKHSSVYANVICKCGNKKEMPFVPIIEGRVKSCGCQRINNLPKDGSPKHGLHKHPIYELWSHIKSRCYYKGNNFYKDYGGRGITVCDEWNNDFSCFYKWAIENGWDNGLQIDRQENDKGYYPSNCRFVVPKVNARNRRSNRFLFFNGESKTVAEWSELLGLTQSIISHRINKLKLSDEEALTRPVKKYSY